MYGHLSCFFGTGWVGGSGGPSTFRWEPHNFLSAGLFEPQAGSFESFIAYNQLHMFLYPKDKYLLLTKGGGCAPPAEVLASALGVLQPCVGLVYHIRVYRIDIQWLMMLLASYTGVYLVDLRSDQCC